MDHGNGETELNDNYNIGIEDVSIAGVHMLVVNSSDKAEPIQHSQAVRQNVTKGSKPNLKRLEEIVQKLDKISAKIGAETEWSNHALLLIDQISMQQEKTVKLEYLNRRYEEESAQLKTLVRDLEKKSLQTILEKGEPCCDNGMQSTKLSEEDDFIRAEVSGYSCIKISPFCFSGRNELDVKRAALSYSQITYLQHDFELHIEGPGELIAYYKIARHYKWALDELFLIHNQVVILEEDMEIVSDWGKHLHGIILKYAFKVFDPGIWLRCPPIPPSQ
ncbi:Alpha-1,3-mannosyl-glycoprotein 2-beta-N-acetylglucosaminyltransferase [Dendrobium catenatum]|uniref:Alpha-1,3-mannosyl-glycoprotein 2-beta-N-acetylglucosaminyltransferase n=1 Tax=Dendrobium catenatum TaxID=906689 RepID=A0A2I0XB52_9ASPA|nr:Alpha-1,3-mannosyl-glycoprotein 2-beta-N-acetylglucosaminyltransferase [Dendrobium catenatum]